MGRQVPPEPIDAGDPLLWKLDAVIKSLSYKWGSLYLILGYKVL